ncbi:uroporphyrinogen decarboxylase [Oxobacter pfennigii]|uniref:Uroporphyrinogen decarboxylase n=1 Tax=Oxobacter pfennigii TaxID=36849 RepID=A0A0P8X451_9CLOT|nr:uroporphyrinogen decarboxylase family protein [Oxobacter pfennigii]KPU45581.1 uroporphyrinogen decarboxylase [Oxobacter pfennigii]
MFDLTGRLTPRENYLRLLKGGHPDYICHVSEITKGMFFDPLAMAYMNRVPGAISKDRWGISWKWLEGHPAANPYVTEETKVIKDIRHWDKYIDVPWPSKFNVDWTEAEKRAQEFDRQNYLLMGCCFTGLFELTHMLMGFEDALMNYIEEPEAMGELLDVLCEFKLAYLKELIDHIKPDMIHIHDDWGNKKDLFMHPDTWRALLKPRWAKIYEYMKSRGVLIQHHADCVCEPIVQDMSEIGIDVWQGVIPQNNIHEIQKTLNGSMALQGGIDGVVFDKADWTEAEVRKEVRRACDEYVPQGYFIPEIPNGQPLTPGINDIVIDELNSYGEHFFKKQKI